MTQEQQLKRIRRKILKDVDDTTQDEYFIEKLSDAKDVYLGKVYPFDTSVTTIPERYESWQVRCALELIQLEEDGCYVAYSENGFSYGKQTDGLSKDLLSELPPAKAGVPNA